MRDDLAALRRDLHELEYLAAEERRDGFIEWAVHHENDAAEVEKRIAALEAKEQVAA